MLTIKSIPIWKDKNSISIFILRLFWDKAISKLVENMMYLAMIINSAPKRQILYSVVVLLFVAV